VYRKFIVEDATVTHHVPSRVALPHDDHHFHSPPFNAPRARLVCLSCSRYIEFVIAVPTRAIGWASEHRCGDLPQEDHWETVARDAFLNGRDHEAIELIKHMVGLGATATPESVLMVEIYSLRAALSSACAHLTEHNNEYDHVTPAELIDAWRRQSEPPH
jgi:hypothetical protein